MSIDKVICPKCGTQNAIDSDNCSSCSLSLIAIRNALTEAEKPSVPSNENISPPTSPRPNIPQFPNMALGEFVNSHTGLLDNMGTHAGEVRAKFCSKLADAKIYFGKGTIGNQDFLFVYFPISGQEAFTIIAVHIEAQGDKLLIERRRYVKLKSSFGVKAWILIVFATVGTYGFYLLLLLLKPHKEWLYRLDAGRTRENQALMSQTHDVTALSLLKDAIKDCGGTDAMLPYI